MLGSLPADAGAPGVAAARPAIRQAGAQTTPPSPLARAERRVRLGLVLAEIGEKNNITVTDDELKRAVMDHVRQFPGQEQKVWDYYRQNPQAVAGLRAAIYEEKVVDFLLELAEVTDKPVSREELYKQDEEAPAAA